MWIIRHGSADYVQNNWLSMTSGACATDNWQSSCQSSNVDPISSLARRPPAIGESRSRMVNNGVDVNHATTGNDSHNTIALSHYNAMSRCIVLQCSDNSWQLSCIHRCFMSSLGANSFARQSAPISDARPQLCKYEATRTTGIGQTHSPDSSLAVTSQTSWKTCYRVIYKSFIRQKLVARKHRKKLR